MTFCGNLTRSDISLWAKVLHDSPSQRTFKTLAIVIANLDLSQSLSEAAVSGAEG